MCAGCWTTDRIKTIDRWPNEEELATILDIERQGGGSAHNVGINLRKLDSRLPISTVGMIGNDADGDFLLDAAVSHKINVSQLRRTSDKATSYSDVMTVADSGKRTFFHHTGTNDDLLPTHFDFDEDNSRILHLGLLSVQAGMSVDPVRNRDLIEPCLPYLDYLIVNDHEIGGIADIPTIQDNCTLIDNCIEAASIVLEVGNMKLVAVHFPEGAICLSREGEQFFRNSYSVPGERIKSTVGAGDAFAAGFLYAMHEEWGNQNALKLAHAVAATSLQSSSAVGAVGSVQQCFDYTQSLNT